MASFDDKTGWQKFVKYIEVPQDQDATYKVSWSDGSVQETQTDSYRRPTT